MNLIDTFFPEHFNQIDRRGVYAGLLISVIAGSLLVVVKPNFIRRDKKPIALLESYSNKVRYKESGAVSFFDVSSNEVLQNSDEIFTGKNSSAVVRFLKSKIIIKIPGSSLVRIEEGENGENIEIKEGVVDIVVQKDQVVNIKSNGVSHQLKAEGSGGVIKAYNTAGALQIYTKESGFKLKDKNGEKLLAPRVEKSVGEALNSQTTFNLLSPVAGQRIDSSGTILIETDRDQKYQLTISKNADFSLSEQDFLFKGKKTSWAPVVEEGDYYLKVADDKNQKIIPLTFFSKFKVEGIYPEDGSILRLNPNEEVILRWNKLPVNSYKVITRIEDGSDVVHKTEKNELSLKKIKGSSVEWSVFPEVGKNKYSNVKSVNRFGINYIGKIQIQENSKKESYLADESRKLSFKWDATDGSRFSVKVINQDSNKEVVTKATNSREAIVGTLAPGKYKTVIESVDYPTFDKAEHEYEVVAPVLTWSKSLPKEIKSIEREKMVELKYEKGMNVDFDLDDKVSIKMQHLIAGRLKSEKTLKPSSLNNVRLSDFGNYCFVAQLNSPMNYYTNSQEYCLSFTALPPFPPLPRANDTILSQLEKGSLDSYKIIAPSIDRAVSYQFEIYSDKQGQKLIFTTSSKSYEATWATRRSGIYYMRYKVYDSQNRSSEFSPFSRVIFPISPLSEW